MIADAKEKAMSGRFKENNGGTKLPLFIYFISLLIHKQSIWDCNFDIFVAVLLLCILFL